MMSREDILLIETFLLALLFFIGGVSDVFRLSAPHPTRRPRQRARRGRKHRSRGLGELLIERLEVTPLSQPQATTSGNGGALACHPIPETREPLKRPSTSWPSRPASRPVAPLRRLPRQLTDDPARTADLDAIPPDQGERPKIVVHYRDGRILKGYSYDFYAHKPFFHLLPPDPGFSLTDEVTTVEIKDLKAVFFVRDFLGNPSYSERKKYAEEDRPLGRKVAVKFPDGEVMVGTTVGYDRQRQGFFLVPADPKSNNLKVFVVSTSVTDFCFL